MCLFILTSLHVVLVSVLSSIKHFLLPLQIKLPRSMMKHNQYCSFYLLPVGLKVKKREKTQISDFTIVFILPGNKLFNFKKCLKQAKTTQHMKVVDPLSSHSSNTKFNVFKTWCSGKHSAGLDCDWLCLLQVCRYTRLQVNLPTCAGRADGRVQNDKNTTNSLQHLEQLWG